MKKVLVIALVVLMAFSLVACGGSDAPATGSTDNGGAATSTDNGGETLKVGVSMPTKSLQRWNQDGDNMKKLLEEAGYEVDLQYAGDNEVPLQVTQIEDMVSGGCKVLVVAAVDAFQLDSPLAAAKEAGVKVISYDRLIMNSDAVSYYATFDNYKVGEAQAQYIIDTLGLTTNKGPFNIELFTGDPGDNNINFFFGGAMKLLQPYIDSGVLVVPSGKTDITQVTTEGWNTEKAQAEMDNRISSIGYGPNGVKLDAVMSNNDSVAQGVTNSLVNAGYTKDNFPALTGQDCDIASTKNMIAGLQGMSVFKDTRKLAASVVKMVDAILQGGEPEINDTETYDNGSGVIPTYINELDVCTPDKVQTMLIDSGYYTEDQLK